MADQAIQDRNQIDVLEADVTVHAPLLAGLFAGGIDVEAGICPTPLGLETIDPKTGALYSHSYIFGYGLPLRHTGALAIGHMNPVVDVCFGLDTGTDTGTDTGVAHGAGDNNNRPGGIADVNLTLPGGTPTALLLTHIGPEDSRHLVPFANSAIRFYNDAIVTDRASDALTLTAEANYAREDGCRAEAYGLAGCASCTLGGHWAVNARAEVFRDGRNFFVSNPAGSLDYVAAERGTPANLITAARPETYSELTLGATYKPGFLPRRFATVLVRPELRYDRKLNGGRPYGAGHDSGVVTVGVDIVLGF